MAGSKVPKLKELREAAGMTQEELGTLIESNGRTIYTYESGIATPSLDSLSIFADYFGVTIDYITGRNVDPVSSDIA